MIKRIEVREMNNKTPKAQSKTVRKRKSRAVRETKNGPVVVVKLTRKQYQAIIKKKVARLLINGSFYEIRPPKSKQEELLHKYRLKVKELEKQIIT